MSKFNRVAPETNGRADQKKKPKKSQADLLVESATKAGVELFRTADGEPYVTAPAVQHQESQHQETHRVTSKAFRLWLAQRFYKVVKKSPGSQALQDAINILSGRALFDGKQMPVYVRVASHGSNVYVDLADVEWRAVEITAERWRVVKEAPVKFIRPRAVLALPEPVRGGRLQELRPFVNVATDGDFVLVLSFLVACLRGRGPFPSLNICGEQGSAKSTTCKIIKSLIDPNSAPLRTQPRDERDLMIAASNGWLVGFDNSSHVPAWFSDALCRLATGGGFSTRELYTDGDEKIFDAQRPVLVNGIENVVTRPDLLDRSIGITAKAIPEDGRRTEAELWAEFEEARPRILGALYDAVSTALRNEAEVSLDKLPRMADFAVWAVAAEPAFEMPVSFMDVYETNRETLNEAAVDDSVIAGPLFDFMRGRDEWTGTPSALYEAVSTEAGEKVTRRREWPKKPNTFSGQLRRIAPNLRRMGWELDLDGKDAETKARTFFIRTGPEKTVSTVSTVSDAQTPGETLDFGDDTPADDRLRDRPQGAGDDRRRSGDDPGLWGSSPKNRVNPRGNGHGDDGDDGDDDFRDSSAGLNAEDAEWF